MSLTGEDNSNTVIVDCCTGTSSCTSGESNVHPLFGECSQVLMSKPLALARPLTTSTKMRPILWIRDLNSGKCRSIEMKSRTGKLSGLLRKLEKLKKSLQTSDLDVIEQSKILRKIIHYRNLLNDQEQCIMDLVIREKAIAAGAKLVLRTPSSKTAVLNSGMVTDTKKMSSLMNSEEESTLVTSLPGSIGIPAESKSKEDPWILSPKESGSPPTSIPVNGIQDWMNSQEKLSLEDLPSKEWIQSTSSLNPFQNLPQFSQKELPMLKKLTERYKNLEEVYDESKCYQHEGHICGPDEYYNDTTCTYCFHFEQ